MARSKPMTDVPSPKQVGRHLKAVRRSKGLSRAEVARSAGLTRRELAAYERGRVVVSETDLWCLAGSCGVDVGELLPDRDPLHVAPDLGSLAVGDTVRRLRQPGEPDGLLREYSSMINELRDLPPGHRIPLRDEDLAALADALGGTPEVIEQRLVELVGTTREDASRLRAMIAPRPALGTPPVVASPWDAVAADAALAVDLEPVGIAAHPLGASPAPEVDAPAPESTDGAASWPGDAAFGDWLEQSAQTPPSVDQVEPWANGRTIDDWLAEPGPMTPEELFPGATPAPTEPVGEDPFGFPRSLAAADDPWAMPVDVIEIAGSPIDPPMDPPVDPPMDPPVGEAGPAADDTTDTDILDTDILGTDILDAGILDADTVGDPEEWTPSPVASNGAAAAEPDLHPIAWALHARGADPEDAAAAIATLPVDALQEAATLEPEALVAPTFRTAGPGWEIGGSFPATAVADDGALALRRAEFRFALADVTAEGDITVEAEVEFTSGAGLGLLFRAEVDADGRLSGYSFDLDPVYGGGSFLVRQWEDNKQHWKPLSQVAVDDPARLYGHHTVTVSVRADRLVARVDGEMVLEVPALTRGSLDLGREPCRGVRVGVQAWSTTEVQVGALRVATH